MAVCFIGHRDVDNKDTLYPCLFALVEQLIQEGHTRFLLGSRSEFNAMAVAVLKELKLKYHHIERIYIRAEYPYIGEDYHAFLLESCDETYFPEELLGASRSVYVKRNQILIDQSTVCVFYCKAKSQAISEMPQQTASAKSLKKSGTQIAYDYALKRKKKILNLFPR